MSNLHVANWNVYYEETIPPSPQASILFIHGSGGSLNVWKPLMSQLENQYHMIALDLPGHGQSPGPPTRNIDHSSRLVQKFAEKMDLPRPMFLAGHSMGAAIVLTCALNFDAFFDGLILMGSGARMKVMPEVLEAMSRGDKNPDFIRVAFAKETPSEIVEKEVEQFISNHATVLFNDLNTCNQFDVSEILYRIEPPVHLIVGREDKLTPVKYSEFLNNNLLVSSLKIVEGAGHFTMLEKPDEVSASITEFIQEHS